LNRVLTAALGATALLATVAPAAASAATLATDNRAAAEVTTAGGGTKPVCQDGAYRLFGGRWTQTYRWSFNAGSTPGSLNTNAVEAVIRKSVSNITGASNDCGRADNVSAKQSYQGRTTRSPNITRQGFCSNSDGVNVIGFGRLPAGVLAVTCTQIFGSVIVESDIKINNRYGWAVSAASCSGRELLEPTMTHEAGHIFGLGHVGEGKHPLLTMSTTSDGACSDDASTLGLGDMLGLEQLY
jgi:hypothetical protein